MLVGILFACVVVLAVVLVAVVAVVAELNREMEEIHLIRIQELEEENDKQEGRIKGLESDQVGQIEINKSIHDYQGEFDERTTKLRKCLGDVLDRLGKLEDTGYVLEKEARQRDDGRANSADTFARIANQQGLIASQFNKLAAGLVIPIKAEPEVAS